MLNVALMGLGWWGKHMTRTLKESDKLNLVRAVDVNKDAVQAKISAFFFNFVMMARQTLS